MLGCEAPAPKLAPVHPTNTAMVQPAAASGATFTNPLLPTGPDPWIIYNDGFYYYMNTTGVNLTLWKTASLGTLRTAEQKVVWIPPATGPYSHGIWAPELHRIGGNWYLYFAADDGPNEDHRLWVLENTAADPMTGNWRMKGELGGRASRWAIDPTVFENRGATYLVYSGWPGKVNGTQEIFIAKLKNPWTVEGEPVAVSRPQYPWEEVGDTGSPPGAANPPHLNVNEGPEVLQHGDRIFLVYSGSGCWTPWYQLGMLTASRDSDLLKPASWKKSPTPVFSPSPQADAYAPGHNGFFQSPDGTQSWIIYHANPGPNEGCGDLRSPRAQPFTWNSDGTPNFGAPVPLGQPLALPSGETHR